MSTLHIKRDSLDIRGKSIHFNSSFIQCTAWALDSVPESTRHTCQGMIHHGARSLEILICRVPRGKPMQTPRNCRAGGGKQARIWRCEVTAVGHGWLKTSTYIEPNLDPWIICSLIGKFNVCDFRCKLKSSSVKFMTIWTNCSISKE